MDAKEVELQLFLGMQNDEGDAESLEESAQVLLRLLADMDVESATLLRAQDYLPFAKGEPLMSGGLLLSVLPAMLPGLMEFLRAWIARNQRYLLQARLQRGEQSVEVVYASGASLTEIQEQREALKPLLED